MSAKMKEVFRQYHLAHKDERNEYARNWYQLHKEEQKVRAKKYNLAVKREVLTHYSDGKCACVRCGESRLACLSIDHIDGNGTRHRRNNNLSGVKIYLWLRKNDYPEGYQTLCMNCQFVKRVENEEYNPYGAVVGSETIDTIEQRTIELV